MGQSLVGQGGGSRYQVEELIASGGQGHVYRALDNLLLRRVAMKVMRSSLISNEDHKNRFFAEAWRMSCLTHPCIPSVHDLGISSRSEPYFTMTLVAGRTLQAVLREWRGDGDGEREQKWTLVALVHILQRVASTVHYIHGRGLLHRDVKPANIGVGYHDEVFVLDWGLSKRFREDPEAVSGRATAQLLGTRVGAVVGTPLYMAPEQALGDTSLLTPHTDVFALGAILYEMLCHVPPHTGDSVAHVVKSLRKGEVVPPSSRVSASKVPTQLEDLCLRALSSNPDDRPESADEFATELTRFIEGSRNLTAQRSRVRMFLSNALKVLQRSQRARESSSQLAEEARRLAAQLPTWAPIDQKRTIWALEDRSRTEENDSARSFAHAMDLAARSLAYDPGDFAARELMARLYHLQFRIALEKGRDEDAAWLRRMVELYNDGPLDEQLRERGHLLLATDPSNADATLVTQHEVDRRWVDDASVSLGTTPCASDVVELGRHVLTIAKAGYAPMRYPILVEPGTRVSIEVRLVSSSDVPPGFLLIPAGTFLSGSSRPLKLADLPSYLIAEFPVRLSEYAAWLDELHATDPDLVERHIPHTDQHGHLLSFKDGRHRFSPASPLASEPIEEHPELPVVGIPYASAEAYASWYGAQINRNVRLPTESEWVKAARGTDGRLCPWGDTFEATYCSCAASVDGKPRLRPVGEFEHDVSPYGVRDCAGGVREWCRPERGGAFEIPVRGGAWYLPAGDCRLDRRWVVEGNRRNSGIGFRLAIPVAAEAARSR